MTAPLIARKTVTHIQPQSVYKDRFILPSEQPAGTTVRREFFDSAGGTLSEVVGEVAGRTVSFSVPYAEVEMVPNGAGFYTYLKYPDEDDEHMANYGTVFRRQLTFPNSPATVNSTVVKKFSDDFQRPAGALGGRWKILMGRPQIFDNGSAPNTVGVSWSFFDRYFCYYYEPFNDDTVEVAFSITDKQQGKTIVTLCQNSQASSYLYVGFHTLSDQLELGFGTSPDVGSLLTGGGGLQPQIEPIPHEIPDLPELGRYIARYDDATGELAVYNSDKTVKYASWVDENNLVPHGRGFRYFGIGGNSGLLNSGAQLAYIEAMGAV